MLRIGDEQVAISSEETSDTLAHDVVEGRNAPSLRRRDILKAGAALGLGAVMPFSMIRPGRAAGLPTLVSSLRSLSNPYHATLNKGAAAFAKSVGADYVTLVTESNSEKALADIKAILSKTGGNCVIDVDPNDTPDARAIVEVCKQAGAYVLTMWNKPDDLHPWDNNPNYVAHISFSGVTSGKATGEALIKAMGGKGGIVAIGGSQSATAGIERKKGLDEALAANPGVQLLDYQIANWSANEAIEKMNAWLTKFGDQIGGVWAANDDMALAAVEALRAEGLAGKVPVTGLDATQLAVEAIQKGEMVGSVSFEPYWHGGIALAIGFAAKTGKLDPAKEPKEHREFYGTGPVVTAANADEFYQNNFKGEPKFDWTDLWGRVSGQITYE